MFLYIDASSEFIRLRCTLLLALFVFVSNANNTFVSLHCMPRGTATTRTKRIFCIMKLLHCVNVRQTVFFRCASDLKD